MRRIRIREGSPAAWIRDLSVGGLMGLVFLGIYLMGL